ncbi:uncharacterized protein HD556DRAFT_1312392 [Suillus plorans]|uniref:Uncharacterized protein n=1 Tax=Suillus plorans TaxID=116603 RepID=A0A9P7AEW1_9AGAM|nr:uncharacterized protein HD556DRAFT_1312392 [Suillus plorans]KAG1787968.1 hypothetical protein HD556DRAFT_1312392 [Suillus plorans]
MSPSPDSNGSSHSDGMISPSLDPFFQQRPANSPILMQQEHEPMGGNGLLSAYMRLEEQVKASPTADRQTNAGMRAGFISARFFNASLGFLVSNCWFTRAAYTKLVESLSLTLDPVGLGTLPSQSLPVTLKAKEITIPSYNRADFPSKFIWTKEDWKKLQEKPSTQLEKSHPLRFVVDKSNMPIPLERVTAIRTTSRRVFVDIWNINEAPKSWGAASGTASKLYTSWRKNHINRLDREGTCKPKAEDIIDFDSLETLDSDDTEGTDTKTNINTKTTKRRTRDSEPLDIRSNSSKKRKSSETSTIESASPSLPVSEVMDSTSQSLVPDGNTPPDSPTSDGHTISTITEPHAASSSKEMATTSAPARFRARPLKFANPLTTVEPANANRPSIIQPSSSEVQNTPPADEPISTQPTSEPTPSIVPTPEHSPDDSAMAPDVHCDAPATIQVAADLMPTPSTTTGTVPPLDASTSKPLNVPAKKSRKMQIGKAQNGRLHHSNLCAREWLTRNKTGSAAEFKVHYDGLSGAQKKSYDELATTKVAAGEWPRSLSAIAGHSAPSPRTSCDLMASQDRSSWSPPGRLVGIAALSMGWNGW